MPKILDRPLPAYVTQGRLMSVRETMAKLGISKRTLWQMTFRYKPSERLPSYKLGKSRKYRFEEVEHWIDLRREAV